MNKVLFIVNGFGLGNSTRSHSMILELIRKNIDVEIIVSSNSYYYFRNYKNLKIYKLKGYTNEIKFNGLFKILKFVLMLIGNYFYNVYFTWKIFNKNKHNLIFIDSDYTLLFLKFFVKVPVIAINNSRVVVENLSIINLKSFYLKLHFIFEYLDFLFHKLIPDLVIVPSFINIEDNKNTFVASPLIRPGLSKKVKKFKNILIASSGSGIGISSSDLTSLDIPDDYTINVIGIVGENYKNIKFLGKIFQNEELLNNSDILVINGGHSSISEAICLQKPFIVIPIENHSEQYVNSQLVLKYGFGVVSKRHEINDKLNYLIKNYDRYFQNLKKYNLPLTGAEISVNFLYSYYMNSSLKHETIKIS